MRKLYLFLCFALLFTLTPVVADEAAVKQDEGYALDTSKHMGLDQPSFKTRDHITIPGSDLRQQPVEVPLDNTYVVSDSYTLDGRAPLVGGVARSFDERKPNVTKTIDLTDYINDAKKTITSVTGEIFWDYGKSYATINTPKSQAATGLLSKHKRIELDDVRIRCETEYATILVISLDGLPINESKKILIQAMTDETGLGYKETVEFDSDGTDSGKRKIVDIGASPLAVRRIKATVELFKVNGNVMRISSLDPHGYLKSEIGWQENNTGGIIVTLPEDSLYTVIEVDEVNGLAGFKKDTSWVLGRDYVWLEGEDAFYTHKFNNYTFGVHEFPDTKYRLSGEDWLTNDGDWTDEDTQDPPTAKWEFEILDEGGVYNFYARKFWHWGPFDYRVDDGPWYSVPDSIVFIDSAYLRKFLDAEWFANGQIEIKGKGKHVFEIRQRNNGKAFGLDCVVFTKRAFIPSQALKPGEKIGKTDSPDYWPFEPEYDEYAEHALLDMRTVMNEDEAGETGYIYMEDGKFYYPNGERMNFWATNVSADVLDTDANGMEYMARKMAKFGVNLIRLHGRVFTFDGDIMPDKLDKYQLFVAACKKAGVYVESSQYFVLWQHLDQSEIFKFVGVDETDDSLIGFLEFQREGYGFRIWNKQMQGLQRQEFKKLLTSPNPYSVPLLNDPALAMIEFENEDSLFFHTWWLWRTSDDQKKVFRKMFGDWLINKYGSIKEAQKAWGDKPPTAESEGTVDNFDLGLVDIPGVNSLGSQWGVPGSQAYKRSFDALEFAMDTQRDYYDSQNKYLKEDLGWRGLTVAGNWITVSDQTMDVIERWTYDGCDIIDRHAYNEYRTMVREQEAYVVQAGDIYIDRTTLEAPQRMAMKAVQNVGKAASISEIMWVSPTKYRAEEPFLQAAYGTLQGHDIVYFFSSGFDWNANMSGKWPVNVPTVLGQFPGFSLMYRRGDLVEGQLIALENVHYNDMLQLRNSKIYNGSMVDSLRAGLN